MTRNPARLLGQSAPTLAPGQPADLVLFRRPEPEGSGFELRRTCVAGRWAEPIVALRVESQSDPVVSV